MGVVAGLLLSVAGFIRRCAVSGGSGDHSTGPLTNISITPTLNCSVNHTG